MSDAWDDEALDEEAQEPARQFATVAAFVAWLAATYRRPVGHGAWWCPSWHLHPEAVHRLTALWDAYETLRAKARDGQALSMADWWLTYCDPTMRALMAPDGPFCECGGAHRERLDPLPVNEQP